MRSFLSGGVGIFQIKLSPMRYAEGEPAPGELPMPEYFEIRIAGHLDPHWMDYFEGLELTHLEGDQTLLSGLLPDQAALHGLLDRIRDLNLILLMVTRGDPPDRDSTMESR